MPPGQHGHQPGLQANATSLNSSDSPRHADQEAVNAAYRRPWSYHRPLHTTLADSDMRSSRSLDEPPAPPARQFTEEMFRPIFAGGAVRPADFLRIAPTAPPELPGQAVAPAQAPSSADTSSSSSAQATPKHGGPQPSSSPLTPLSSTPRPRPTRGRGQATTPRAQGRGRGGKRGSGQARGSDPGTSPLARRPLRAMAELDNTLDGSPGVARVSSSRVALDGSLDSPISEARPPAKELARSNAGPPHTLCPPAAFDTPISGIALLIAAAQSSFTSPARAAAAAPTLADLFNSPPPPMQASRLASPVKEPRGRGRGRRGKRESSQARAPPPATSSPARPPPRPMIELVNTRDNSPGVARARHPRVTLDEVLESRTTVARTPTARLARSNAGPSRTTRTPPASDTAPQLNAQLIDPSHPPSALPAQANGGPPTVTGLCTPPPIQAPRPASPMEDWSANSSDERALAIASSSSWVDDEPKRATKKAGKSRSTKATKTKTRTRSTTPIWEQGRPETRARAGEGSSSVPMLARSPIPKSRYRDARSRAKAKSERKTKSDPKPKPQAKRSRSVMHDSDESVVEVAAPPGPSNDNVKRRRIGHEDPVVDDRPPLRSMWDIDDFGSDTDVSESDALRQAIEQEILVRNGRRGSNAEDSESRSHIEYEAPVVDDRPPLRQAWALTDFGIEIPAAPAGDDQRAAAQRPLISATQERQNEDAAPAITISNTVSDMSSRSC